MPPFPPKLYENYKYSFAIYKSIFSFLKSMNRTVKKYLYVHIYVYMTLSMTCMYSCTRRNFPWFALSHGSSSNNDRRSKYTSLPELLKSCELSFPFPPSSSECLCHSSRKRLAKCNRADRDRRLQERARDRLEFAYPRVWNPVVMQIPW